MNILNLFISSLVQAILFSAIPFIWWAITLRKNISFFQWIGLKKISIKNKKRYILIFAGTILIFIPSLVIIAFVGSDKMATSRFSGKGISALIPEIHYKGCCLD
ncbi:MULTISPECIES: hypothetical protein [Tissierellales]|uniref:Uncharacterized protein n=1 Tax=Acidilutibacter cellobiosedens TaxID=2507161 RepID=A0A410QGZ7_9FIRM|nr:MULTISPECIES: hypothetical protein [Tissierellales]MBE6081233.1 hypothetical protein [Tissierellaceae bacterium]QAT63277.1 hypothetical protein EQM13_17765 [Acidilutibacter cellobiosedens]SCL95805.1 hypothetical protein PP176A_2970 [Sporanaerobacter sp. PP17-6a]